MKLLPPRVEVYRDGVYERSITCRNVGTARLVARYVNGREHYRALVVA